MKEENEVIHQKTKSCKLKHLKTSREVVRNDRSSQREEGSIGAGRVHDDPLFMPLVVSICMNEMCTKSE